MTRLLVICLAAIYFVPAVAISLSAQNAQSTQPRDSSQPVTQTSATPPAGKKIWTNDDLSGLHNDAGSSSVGSSPAPTRSTQPTAQASKRNAAWYRDQISKLQAKIPLLDTQIAALQSAIEGKPTGDAKKSVRPYSVRADDWSVELGQLSEKRDDIFAKITALRDEAHRSGVPANALP
jgi:predicted secreted hydrolase